MLRYMVPYLLTGLILAAAGGALYGTGAIGVLGVYATGLAATLITGAGYARWDERHHPPGARHH
jgi:hypothetical protein